MRSTLRTSDFVPPTTTSLLLDPYLSISQDQHSRALPPRRRVPSDGLPYSSLARLDVWGRPSRKGPRPAARSAMSVKPLFIRSASPHPTLARKR